MKTILAITLLLSASSAFSADHPTPSIEVGQPFPVLELPLANDQGKAASIMDYRGRKLMLHLFASW